VRRLERNRDERETRALDLNLCLYLSLFLLLVGLLVFSLVRRKQGEKGGQSEAAGTGAATPEPDDRGRGE